MPYRDDRTKKFYTDIRPRVLGVPTGRRIRRLMPKVKTWAEAEEEERRIQRDIQLELSGERRVSPPFEEFARGEYMRWVRGNKKRPGETLRLVGILCRSPHFQKRLDDITPDDIERFKADMRSSITNRGRRMSPATVNTFLSELSAVFRQAVAAGRTKANPVHAVNYLSVDAAPFRVLEYDEEPVLMETLLTTDPYLRPLSQIALLTGMRLGELLNLRVEDVDFGRDLLRVRDPKWPEDKRKTEGLPFSQEVRAILLGLPARRGLFFSTEGGGKMRQASVSSHFSYQAQRRAGLTGLTFHSLRHTFGTRLARAGHSAFDIARLMGHSDIKTTMRYIHPEQKNLREAVERLSERPKVLEFPQTGQRAGSEG